MNRDDDMAHTIHPLSANAEAAYQRGEVIACVSASDAAAFARSHPDAVTGTVWAGPGMTLWYTAQEPTAAARAARELANW